MLERALMHVRAAMILRDCAARAGSDGERRLLIGMASIHEARARHAIGRGRRPGGHGPGQARR